MFTGPFTYSGLKKYFFNTSWLILEKTTRMVAYFFVGVYVVRYLGPADFGKLSYAVSIIGIVSVIAGLGLEQVLVKHLVMAPEDRLDIIGTAFALKIVAAGIATAIAVAYSWLLGDDPTVQAIIWIIAGGMFFQCFNVVDSWYQSRISSRYTVYSSLISILVASGLRVWCVYSGKPLIYFAWLITGESAAIAAGLFICYHVTDKTVRQWRFRIKIARKMLAESWPLIFSGFVGVLLMRIDHVMLKEMVNQKTVGEYSAALKLAEAWYFIPMVISSSLAPAITRAKGVSSNFYKTRLVNLYGLLTFISVFLSSLTIVFSEHIVRLLYGKQFTSAASILSIYVVSNIFVSFGVAKSIWVVLENQQSATLIIQSIGTGLNIALNLFLIPVYGAHGAAMATLAALISNTLIMPLFFNAKQREQVFLFIKSFNPCSIFQHPEPQAQSTAG